MLSLVDTCGHFPLNPSLRVKSVDLDVPQQPSDSNNCAFFALSFAEFFCHAELRELPYETLKDAQLPGDVGNQARLQLKDLMGNKHEGFLTSQWFDTSNPNNLRDEIRSVQGL